MAKILKTITALSKDQGVSRQTIHTWQKHEAWTFGSKNFDGEAVARWRAEHIHERNGADAAADADNHDSTTNARRRVELQLKAEQALMLREKRAQLQGKYIDRDIHNKAMIGLVNSVRGRLEEAVQSLPTLLEKLSVREIRGHLLDWYDRFCADMETVAEFEIRSEEAAPLKKNAAKARAAHRRHAR